MDSAMNWIPLGSDGLGSIPKKQGKEFTKVHQSLLSRFRFKGGVYSILSYDYDFDELLKWIKEDCDKTIFLQDMSRGYVSAEGWYHIKFKTKESAMAFKLRWL